MGSWSNAVSTVCNVVQGISGLIRGRYKTFFSSPKYMNWPWGPPSLLFEGDDSVPAAKEDRAWIWLLISTQFRP